jgi:hypothetical protein
MGLTGRFVLVLVLPTSPRRSKLREAMSDKPGGYVGQAVFESGRAE